MMSDNHDQKPAGEPRGTNRKLIALATVAALGVGGAFGVQAIAQSDAYQHMRVAAYDGGWRARDHKPLEEMSDAEIEDRITRMVKHVAIEIDATPEQQDRIITLVTVVAKDLRPLKERMHFTGKELQHLLTTDPIDRDALENLRATRLAEAEQISKTLVSTIADVAEILTPEQREMVKAFIQESHEKRRRHHRG